MVALVANGGSRLLDAFKSIADQYPTYLAGRRTDKNNAAHKLIVSAVPRLLEQLSGNRELLKFEGSAGKGNMTPAPWMAVYHSEVTTSATDGSYLVYLLSLSMKKLVLEIGLGATQFEKRFGTGKRMIERVEEGAALLRQTASHIPNRVLPADILSRLSVSKVELLDGMRSKKHEAYEKCSIYSLTYDLSETTNQNAFEDDYKHMLALYCAMVDSPVVPLVDDLPWADAVPKPDSTNLEIQHFVPLVKKQSRDRSSSIGSQRKYSKQSDKVGREGERLVFDHEKRCLEKLGRPDLAAKVIWHRDYPKDRTPGRDITSFDEKGRKIYIEVKSSIGSVISSVQLNSNEWEVAGKPSIRNFYKVYLVKKALSTKPEITILTNPHAYVESGALEVSVDTWLLDLREKKS